MCELCAPTMTRRRALALAGAATAAAVLGTPDRSAAASALRTGYGVDIEPRAAWAGDTRPYLGEPASEDVRFLLVHHTAGPSTGDPIELMRDVYRFHTSTDKGWPDVAYNFFIEPGGGVYEARAGSLTQAVEASATGGNQGFAQLVCLLGDFTAQNPTPEALATLNATLAWLADRYGLDTSPAATTDFVSRGSNRWVQGTEVTANVISGHRDMSQTACPGDTFYPYLVENVQSQVDQLRGNPAPVLISTTDSTQAPFPVESTPVTDEPTPLTTEVAQSTSTQPASTTTVASETTGPQTTGSEATDSQATVPSASGGVVAAPEPQADESAVDAASSGESATPRSSSNAAAWALGAGATAAVGAAALYVGVRGRHADTDRDVGPQADAAAGQGGGRPAQKPG